MRLYCVTIDVYLGRVSDLIFGRKLTLIGDGGGGEPGYIN